MSVAIVTQSLAKSYGTHRALQGVDLEVPEGELVGFLGPNGAGKTTTLRILLGLLRADGGRAEVLGRDPWRDGVHVRRRVGYLPGDVRFYDSLTGRRLLAFVDAMRGGGGRRESLRLAERLNLRLDRQVRTYSRGMKQKLGLIAAMMHRPALLILDEPTTGLDPLVRHVLFDELRAVTADGRSVLFSSHTLAEVQELCERVAIVRHGRVIEQDRVEVLRDRAVRRVDVRFASGAASITPPAALRVSKQGDGRLVGAWTGPVDPLLRWLGAQSVTDVTIAPPDLDDLFLAYYREEEGGEAS